MKIPTKVLWAMLTLSPLLHTGCHRNCDTERPIPVQVLGQASEVLNPDLDGTAWALNLWLVELKSGQSIEGIDGKAVIAAEKDEEEESPFGEDRLKSHERTIFRGEKKVWGMELGPETTHVVTVSNYRQLVGDAWMNVYELPPNYPQQRCDAERKRKRKRTLEPESAACIYLAFDSNEVRGGRYRPAGLDLKDFSEMPMTCAPIVDIDEKKRKKEERRRKRKAKRKKLKAPSLPSTSPPTTPTPTAPTAPTAPATPTAVKPTLPVPR